MCLTINTQSDRYGWLTGSYETADGELVHIDIMPPIRKWEGDVHLLGFEPHKTDWVVYIDGDETGRVTTFDDIEEAIWRTIT